MSATFEDVKRLVNGIVFYMKQDWVSFQAVVESKLDGKLGGAAITNACSAIDLFSWLTTGANGVNARWRVLLNHPSKYFGDPTFFHYDLVYEVSPTNFSSRNSWLLRQRRPRRRFSTMAVSTSSMPTAFMKLSWMASQDSVTKL